MKDWNVVVTVSDRFARYRAQRGLARFGKVERSAFHNVLVMRVDDTARLMASLTEMMGRDMTLINDLSRLMPAQETFDFATREEFDAKASAVILGWADRVAGRTFHIRLHRRGMGHQLSSLEEEKLLAAALLDRLVEIGQPGRIDFADPDCVIDIETVGGRAGLSLWTREELRRYPFLTVD